MPQALSTPMLKQIKAMVTSSPSSIALLEGDEAGGTEGGVEGAASVMAPSERAHRWNAQHVRVRQPQPTALCEGVLERSNVLPVCL